MIEIEPHRKRNIVGLGGRVTHVSSVHYRSPAKGVINETCVFFPDGNSEVRGSYDDHDRVVGQILDLEGGLAGRWIDEVVELHTALDAARQAGDIELRDRLRRLILSLLMERRSR